MTTQELNNRLEVKKMNNVKFGNEGFYTLFSGHALFIEGHGYIRFKDSPLSGGIVKYPYYPCGKVSALKDIIKGGGFIHYNDIEFINPIK